ncbi:MAG: serine/threonine protein kinase, partial [Gemmataceae bacterium]|nr:serine/threonine protein kinase [Gemmataceae bacterium]
SWVGAAWVRFTWRTTHSSTGLPQRPAAALIRKLAQALAEAHARGVIHRDLKPANVMVNQRNEPVIMDFGLARRAQDPRLTSPGAVMGTPAYMPPEQVLGDVNAVGPASDVYSLGVMLFEMLTGRLPFEGPVMAVLGQILTQDPPRPGALRPDLDPELEGICLRALARRLEARYPSMGEFAAALTRYLNKEATDTAAPRVDVPEAPETVPVTQAPSTLGASPPGEGLATDLLARLVERLERAPGARAGAERGSKWWPFLAAGCILVLGGIVFSLVWRRDTPPIQIDNTVIVQLSQSLTVLNDPTIAILVVGDREYTRDDLSRPISLPVGDHVVTIKRKDGPDETRTLTVKGDGTVDLSDPPPKELPTSPGTIAGQDQLPVRVSWRLGLLDEYFTFAKVTFDSPNNQVVWQGEVKRNFDSTSALAVRLLYARFYDADGARVHHSPLHYSANFLELNVKKGDQVRVFLGMPDEATLKRTARVLMLGSEDEFPPKENPVVKAEDPARLPGSASWDLKPLQEDFTLLKVIHDAKQNWVFWLAEAKRRSAGAPSPYLLRARFYDADGARIADSPVSCIGHINVLKGERIYLGVGVPNQDTLKKIRTVKFERP